MACVKHVPGTRLCVCSMCKDPTSVHTLKRKAYFESKWKLEDTTRTLMISLKTKPREDTCFANECVGASNYYLDYHGALGLVRAPLAPVETNAFFVPRGQEMILRRSEDETCGRVWYSTLEEAVEAGFAFVRRMRTRVYTHREDGFEPQLSDDRSYAMKGPFHMFSDPVTYSSIDATRTYDGLSILFSREGMTCLTLHPKTQFINESKFGYEAFFSVGRGRFNTKTSLEDPFAPAFLKETIPTDAFHALTDKFGFQRKDLFLHEEPYPFVHMTTPDRMAYSMWPKRRVADSEPLFGISSITLPVDPPQ